MIDSIDNISNYDKCIKDMVTKYRSVCFEDDDRMQHRSAIAITYLMQNKEDLDSFTIPCTIELLHFSKMLCDLDESISLMPLFIHMKIG